MIYQLTLQTTGLAAGLVLVVSHVLGLINAPASIRFARGFLRSRAAGTVLLLAAAVWSFVLVTDIDLGEFSKLRNLMLIGIVVGAVLSWLYVEEFLAVRALGMLLLLAAEPLLESCALRAEESRLLLVSLAYAWIIAGLFFVGMPYLMRDAIKILSAKIEVWRIAALGGLVYGVILTAAAIFWW
ncbi:MAG: hypothetical protein ACKOHM_06715 [Spartobacteria bacterium]